MLNINSKVLLEIPQGGNKIVPWLVRELDQEIVWYYIFRTVAAKKWKTKLYLMNSYLSVLIIGRINSQHAVDFHIRILFLKNTNNMFHFQLVSCFHFVIDLKGEYKFTAAPAKPLSFSKVN